MSRSRSPKVRAGRLNALRGKLHRRWEKFVGYWSENPSVDLFLVLIPTLTHALIVWHFKVGNILEWASDSQRTDTYAAGAAVSALVAGFTGTAIAQYGSSSGPLIAWLRAVHGSKIRKNWLSITKWLMAVATLCVFGMAIDGGSEGPKGSNWIFEAAFFIAIAKFVRLVYLFDLILSSVDKQDEERLHIERTKRRQAKAFSGRASKASEPTVHFDEED